MTPFNISDFNYRRSTLPAFILMILLASCSSKENPDYQGKKAKTDSIILSHAWARPGSKGGNSAAYLTIYNGTTKADTLLSVHTDAASKAEVHESYQMQNGMAGMRPAPGLTIPPGDSLILRPGKFHIMMMQLKRHLAIGDSVLLRLSFLNQDTVAIFAPVKRIAE